jgi:hypothetical protein
MIFNLLLLIDWETEFYHVTKLLLQNVIQLQFHLF